MASGLTVAPAGAALNAEATGVSAPDRYRAAWAQLPSAVHVVAGRDQDGVFGATVSAVCSLSLDPMLLLLCLDEHSTTLARLTAAGAFAVNALPDQQSALATRFATRARGSDKFRGFPYRIAHRVPVFDQALAWFVCNLHRTYEGGDHAIVVGAVTAVHLGEGQPLIRQDNRYRSLARDPATTGDW